MSPRRQVRERLEKKLARVAREQGLDQERLLRFAQRARATKDLDLGMEGNRADRLQALAEALRLGFDEFSFRLKAQTRDMELADTVRVEVALQYRTRSWQTIEVDLGSANPT